MKRALVIGGSGALGREVVACMLKAGNWDIVSVDSRPNDAATANVLVPSGAGLAAACETVHSNVRGQVFDSILCVAGGWVGGNAADPEFPNAVDKAIAQSVNSSVTAVRLAALTLRPSGLLLLTGAMAAAPGKKTPSMLAYGMAKAAVHHLVGSLADPVAAGLPQDAIAAAILPVVLDTPANRAAMPNAADKQTWTPLPALAAEIATWAADPKLAGVRPGALYCVRTVPFNDTNKTSLELVQ